MSSSLMKIRTTISSTPMIATQRSLRIPISLVQWTIHYSRRRHSFRCFSIASVAPPKKQRLRLLGSQLDSSSFRRFSVPPPGGLESNNPSHPPTPSSIPIPAVSSDTTAPPPSVINDDKSSSIFRDELKKKSGSQAHAQKPRPVFPWRHDFFPIPRLVPGTKEYEEAGRSFVSGWVATRTTAIWFLNAPFVTAFFRFSSWKQDLADEAAYAFAQGVAGILSNVSERPLHSIAVEDEDALPIVNYVWNDDEEEEEENNQQPATKSKEPVDLTTESVTASMDGIATLSSSAKFDPNGDNSQSHQMSTPEDTTIKSTAATQEEKDIDVSNESIPVSTDAANTSTAESSHVSSTSTDESNVTTESSAELSSMVTQSVKKHPAFQRPFVHKTYVDPSPPPVKDSPPPQSKGQLNEKVEEKTEPSKTATETDGDPQFDLDINEMMIEPLRKLYESAHQSGRDQLIIRLQMKPIEATLYNLMCIPYVTRELALKNPERLRQSRMVKFGQEGMRTVLDNLEHDLDQKGKLETTVEMQVLISCLESFQVLDRETGAVLQGSADGLLQEVTHLVRFETTSVQEIKDGRAYNYYKNWKITDIDDMLGHVAWYQK